MMFVSPEGVFPLFIGDVKIAEPSWNNGETLPEGWREIEETPHPEITYDEVAEFLNFEEVDGKLKQVWTVRPLTSEEIEARDAKQTLKNKLNTLELNASELGLLAQALI